VKENVSYVPPAVAYTLNLVTGTLERFRDEGLINRLEVAPEYRGDSFVPTRISMRATHSAQEGSFEPSVKVW
jgi:hypothetical protein